MRQGRFDFFLDLDRRLEINNTEGSMSMIHTAQMSLVCYLLLQQLRRLGTPSILRLNKIFSRGT